ncbi:MAG: hypothetical protein HYZ65_12650 [Burkholderiales bacterium]|nr:hypothetical protein [Burkholderiales bacterium]
MSKLLWHVGSVVELSQLLMQADLERSLAVGGATVYHFMHEGQERLAISLADGLALIVQPAGSGRPRRRRRDPLKSAIANSTEESAQPA